MSKPSGPSNDKLTVSPAKDSFEETLGQSHGEFNGQTTGEQKPNPFRQWSISLLKILFAVSIIYWLITKKAIDFDAFASIMTPSFFVGGLLLVFICLFANNLRWKCLLDVLGYRFSSWALMRLTLIGIFFNFVFPGGVGGDVIKGIYLIKGDGHGKKSKTKAFLTILLDRALGLFNLVFMTLAVSIFYLKEILAHSLFVSLFYGVLTSFAILSIGMYLAFFQTSFLILIVSKVPVIRRIVKIRELIELMGIYGEKPGVLVKIILLSWLSQIPQIFVVMVVGSLLGFTIPAGIYFFLVPMGVVSTLLPLAPAGVGVAQASMYFLFKTYLTGSENVGTLGMTSLQIFTFAWGLVGAFLFLQIKRVDKKLPHQKEANALITEQNSQGD